MGGEPVIQAPPRPLEPGQTSLAAGLRAATGRWLLQDARPRLSELVRRVETEAPQPSTAARRSSSLQPDEYRRLKGEVTGQALIEMLQASPHRDVEIAPPRARAPNRDVNLVTAWLLDTNVLSELRRPRPEPKVVTFIAAQKL